MKKELFSKWCLCLTLSFILIIPAYAVDQKKCLKKCKSKHGICLESARDTYNNLVDRCHREDRTKGCYDGAKASHKWLKDICDATYKICKKRCKEE